jgi:protein-tyrosine phosphatase
MILQKKTRIIMVCMGNICRSPTAEGVLRHKLAMRGLSKMIEVDSAGTHANHVGAAPDPRAQAHAAKRGYDLSKQRARRLRGEDFATFDHLLAMDWDNLALMEEKCPSEHKRKVGLLMRFARKHTTQVVPDPYYGGPNGFEAVLDYIEDACDGLIETVLTGPAAP